MEYGQVGLWVVMFVALSTIGLPISSALFTRFSSRGAGFAPTIALGVVSIVAYWVGHFEFGPLVLVPGLFVLCYGATLAVRRGVEIKWLAFGEAMTVFVVAFCFQVAVRAVDPGILFFVEDFLDYGVMRSVLRSEYLPPEDFWFAGTRIRYHYGGHLVAALETMLSGTRPSIAYNLALAGFYAMLLAGVYELAGAIADENGRSRRIAGVLGAYFVGFAGNLLAPVVMVVQALPRPVSQPVAGAIASQLHRNAAKPVVVGMSEFEYWDVLQMMPNTLTPFPLFAWFHGELHAHMTSTPFLLLVVATCYAYYLTPQANRWERRALAFVALPLAAGFTLLTDALSAPTSMGMVWLTFLFARATPATLFPSRVRGHVRTLATTSKRLIGTTSDERRGWAWTELRRITAATVLTAIVSVLTIAVSSPFVVNTATGAKESAAVVAAANRSSLVPLLLIHGPFLAVFAPYLVGRVYPQIDATLSRLEVMGTVGTLSLAVLALLLEAPVVLLFLPLLTAGWYLLRTNRVQFETVLILAGVGLVLLVEFVYVANQEYVVDGRGNTVFRAYTQVWIFWGIAAGVILPRLVRPVDVSWLQLPRRRTVATTFVVILLLSTGVYGGVSTYRHFDRAFEEPPEPWGQAEYVYYATQFQDREHPPTEPPTVEGLLYAEVNYPDETQAIKWLDRNVDGTPTIVTAPGGRWEWRSAAAALTGIPTVAGWAHELVYREWDTYYARVDDVRTIYRGSPERRIQLLSKYDVQYIWVGPGERQRYDVWEFSLLDGVSVAYRNEEVTVYEVDQSTLDYSPEPVGTREYDAGAFGVNASVAAHENGRIVASGRNDTLAWWGPFATLPPGEYVATFRVAVDAPENQPAVVVDVARGAARNGTADYRVLGNATLGNTDGVRTVRVPFTLTQPAADVEFRGILASEDGTVRFHGVRLRRKSGNGTAPEPPRHVCQCFFLPP